MTIEHVPQIQAFIKDPGRNPRHIVMGNKLQNFQIAVGGYIEAVTISLPDHQYRFKKFVVICNEEGRLNGMLFNCNICGFDFYGPIILCGISGEDFATLPVTTSQLRKMLPQLWEVPNE